MFIKYIVYMYSFLVGWNVISLCISYILFDDKYIDIYR